MALHTRIYANGRLTSSSALFKIFISSSRSKNPLGNNIVHPIYSSKWSHYQKHSSAFQRIVEEHTQSNHTHRQRKEQDHRSSALSSNNDPTRSRRRSRPNKQLAQEQTVDKANSQNSTRGFDSLFAKKDSSHRMSSISQRLSFYFSDVNLCHDRHMRSILQQHQHQYLPLDELMKFQSIKRLTLDPNVVVEAVHHASSNSTNKSQSSESSSTPIKLHIMQQQTNSGEEITLIGRTPPFNYRESFEKSCKKGMVVDGWPLNWRTAGVESLLRSFLCDINGKNSKRQSAIAYWGRHKAKGRIFIEFETEEGARNAWMNLERRSGENKGSPSGHFTAAGSDDYKTSNEPVDENGLTSINVLSLHSGDTTDEEVRSDYQLQIKNMCLVLRPLTMSFFDDESMDNVNPVPVASVGAEATALGDFSKIDPNHISIPLPTWDAKNVGGDSKASLVLDEKSAFVDSPIMKDIPPAAKEDASDSSPMAGTGITSGSNNVRTASSEEVDTNTISNFSSSTPDDRNKARRFWDEDGATLSLRQFVDAMDQLSKENKRLPLRNQAWFSARKSSNESINHFNKKSEALARRQTFLTQQRLEICKDVSNLLTNMKLSIAEGKIRALGGKDGYLVSDSLTKALFIYSGSPSVDDSYDPIGNQVRDIRRESSVGQDGLKTDSFSPYEACIDAMKTLKTLNLDIHPLHFSYAIKAACHESRWEEAANLFLSQVDGGDTSSSSDEDFVTGGWVPVDSALGWNQPLQIGLFAVARDARNKFDQPSKKVIDVAMKMCMISPSCQENYILAAGAALGKAGLWSDFLDFATDPENISNCGPSIAAAAILACIEGSHYKEALDAFNYFMSGNEQTASEWQWDGGSRAVVKPQCQDLTLCAMGKIVSGGYSRDAMALFRDIIKEDGRLTRWALLGLARSLEHDGDWQSSVQFLDSFIANLFSDKDKRGWNLVRELSDLRNNTPHDEGALTKSEQMQLVADVVASAMRVCIHNGHFGLAILISSIGNLHHIGSSEKLEDYELIQTSVQPHHFYTENDQVLEAFSRALLGLGCKNIFFDPIEETHGGTDIDMSIEKRHKHSQIADSWLNAMAAMNRVLVAKQSIGIGIENVSKKDRLLIERGLARAMEHCIDSKQPTAAIYLLQHMRSVLLPKIDSSLSEKVKAFLGVHHVEDMAVANNLSAFGGNFELKGMSLSSPILSAVTRANREIQKKNDNDALEKHKLQSVALESFQNNFDSSQLYPSPNPSLDTLLDTDSNSKKSYFDTTDIGQFTPGLFLKVARYFESKCLWADIGDIYDKANNVGCNTEELCFIAMRAVCESDVPNGKMRILRKIVDDASNMVGMTKKNWIESQYWTIKKKIGFHQARLLMNWNDPSTSQMQELVFAVKEMRQHVVQGLLTKNATLFCIVKQSRLFGTTSVESLELSVEIGSAISIILDACTEAKRSGLIQKKSFTMEVAKSLRALGGNKECISFVRGLIEGGRCKHRFAMEQAIYAALEEHDKESLDIIITVFEESGYDSSHLSQEETTPAT